VFDSPDTYKVMKWDIPNLKLPSTSVVFSAFYGNHHNISLAQDPGSDNRNVYKCQCIPTHINPDTFYITVYVVTKNCGLQDPSEFGTSKL